MIKQLAIIINLASKEDDLDKACILIQDQLGIEDGGQAGLFFMNRIWGDMIAEDRLDALIDYIESEIRLETLY